MNKQEALIRAADAASDFVALRRFWLRGGKIEGLSRAMRERIVDKAEQELCDAVEVWKKNT